MTNVCSKRIKLDDIKIRYLEDYYAGEILTQQILILSMFTLKHQTNTKYTCMYFVSISVKEGI